MQIVMIIIIKIFYKILSGTGKGRFNKIISYDGSLKQITLNVQWLIELNNTSIICNLW